MKSLLVLALTAVVSTASAAEIPAGTHLLLRMEHSVSTRTAKVGDGVHLRTSIPLSAGGRIVIPIGSYAQGVVSEVKHGKQAGIQLQLMTLMLPNGEVLSVAPKTSSVESDQDRRGANERPFGASHPGATPLGLAVAGAIAGGQIGARIGLGAGAAVILISAIAGHRRDMELRQGAAVDVVFDQPAVIEQLNGRIP
jgi:hypothetical protein